jgi:transposase-like protein
MLLSCAPRLNRPGSRHFGLLLRAGVGAAESNKNIVRRILKPGVWFMQLPGSLARQLAELVAIGHMRECPEN